MGGCGVSQDPSSDKLLPDLPPGLGHVRTLVLDLNDVRALCPTAMWSL